jgi:CRP-like cAMP-binding protein
MTTMLRAATPQLLERRGSGALSVGASASSDARHESRRCSGRMGNLLLDALPDAPYRRFEPHLELVPLPVGRVLAAPNDRLTHVYFPTSGVVSLLTQLEDGTSEEVAVTGNEGLIGISAFLEAGSGGAVSPRHAVVQHAGQAWRLPADLLAEQFAGDGEIQRLLLRYTQALITQIAQTAVCNRHHRIVEQLCRWLLLRLDRLSSCELHATQERIANLVGVRREGIAAAVADLRRAELIRGKRGRITVLDRSGLEQRVCECYTVIQREYARLLPHQRPRRLTQK